MKDSRMLWGAGQQGSGMTGHLRCMCHDRCAECRSEAGQVRPCWPRCTDASVLTAQLVRYHESGMDGGDGEPGTGTYLPPSHLLQQLDTDRVDNRPQSLLWEQIQGLMAMP